MIVFSREIHHVLVILLVLFISIALAAAYWGIAGAESLLLREDNPRLVEAEAAIVRGNLVDRQGRLLVESRQDEQGRISRYYSYPPMDSVLGYASLRYGVGGIEAMYDDLLRGDPAPNDVQAYLAQSVLHQQQRGTDLRLALDLDVQRTAFEALQGASGAAVVMAVPSGEVLALVSLPSFDPRTLDADWDRLTAQADKPFFNRVLQGRYQAGGALQTPLLAAALLAQLPRYDVIPSATEIINLDHGVTLGCTRSQPLSELTLIQIYTYGCPNGFVLIANQIGETRLRHALETFQLARLPELDVNAVPTPSVATDPMAIATEVPETFTEMVVGQGNLTINPMSMARFVAAIINDGNAPEPLFLRAIRPPDALDWSPAMALMPPNDALMTANVARGLQEIMIATLADGTAQAALEANYTIGGHASRAYVGDNSHVWFIGFIVVEGHLSAVSVVVLEQELNVSRAATLGGQLLLSAYHSLKQTAP